MIGIIGAMESEVVTLISSMENRESECVCGITYERGRLCGQDVVVARAGIGKVNAAICAQTMLLRYAPTGVVNTGVAGALSPELGVGNCVVATHFAEHDMDTTPVGDPMGLILVKGEQLTRIPADPTLGEGLAAAARRQGMRVLQGSVATGDQFIHTEAQKSAIRSNFDALACEMEGVAIAHACYGAGVPFCALRVISDTADGSAQVDYPTFVKGAAAASAAALMDFLSTL